MSKVHNFVETELADSAFNDGGNYYRTLHCTKCGLVAWYHNRSADWNMELQKRVKDRGCI